MATGLQWPEASDKAKQGAVHVVLLREVFEHHAISQPLVLHWMVRHLLGSAAGTFSSYGRKAVRQRHEPSHDDTSRREAFPLVLRLVGHAGKIAAASGGFPVDASSGGISSPVPWIPTVTGGEPLAQKACLVLLTALCDAQYSVSLETSGALELSGVDTRVCKVMDIKTPGSGEMTKNNWLNLAHLTQQDEIKFVLCDEADYQWAWVKLFIASNYSKYVLAYFHLFTTSSTQ